jgi:hypothetical protein
VSGLALLLSAPVFAAPQDYGRQGAVEFQADRLSTQGRISSVSRVGDSYRISLDRGSYSYLVPTAVIGTRDLRIGSNVRLSGILNGNIVSVDMLALPGEANYTADPYYRAVPFGSTGWMSGTVQRLDRHLGYLQMKDDASGQVVKIDVRHMNLRRPVNVWGIRPGDHVSINGSWENRDTFDARRIEY